MNAHNMTTPGRLWLTRDIVRAAEKVPFGNWPNESMHTVHLHIPQKPTAKKNNRNTYNNTSARKTTLSSSPTSSQSSIPTTTYQTSPNLAKKLASFKLSHQKDEKIAQQRLTRELNDLTKNTSLMDEKLQKLMETAQHRKKQLKMARKGTIIKNQHPDLHKLRKDLAQLTSKHNKATTSQRVWLKQKKRKHQKRQRNKPALLEHVSNQRKEQEEQWRHNLTLLFQNGLKEMNHFFQARGRSMTTAHRKEVLATLSEYHKLLNITFSKIRTLRAEQNGAKRGKIQLADSLWLRLTSIEQDCRYIETSSRRLNVRVHQRENFARIEANKKTKEISKHRSKVKAIQYDIDNLVMDHKDLLDRKDTMQKEIDTLKLQYKNHQVYIHRTKQEQQQMLGIEWTTKQRDGTMKKKSSPKTIKKMSMSRRTPRVEKKYPIPTDSDAINAILSELSGRARTLDSLRNCLVCFSCFKLSKSCLIEWKSGELLCSHCSLEKGYVLETKEKVVEEDERNVSKGVTVRKSVSEGKEKGVHHQEEGEEEEDDEESEEEEEEEEDEDSEEEDDMEVIVPLKDVLNHPRLRALENMFIKHNMYTGQASSVNIASGRGFGKSNGMDVDQNEMGGPLEMVRSLGDVLRNGFKDLKVPQEFLLEETKKMKELIQVKEMKNKNVVDRVESVESNANVVVKDVKEETEDMKETSIEMKQEDEVTERQERWQKTEYAAGGVVSARSKDSKTTDLGRRETTPMNGWTDGVTK